MTNSISRMNICSCLRLAIFLLSYSLLANGQSQSQYDKGTPPQHAVGVSALGSYTSTELGTINLANGALNFKIPLATIGGRGGVSIPLTLNYSSKVWSASIDTDTERETMTEKPVAFAEYDAAFIHGGSNLQNVIGAGWSIGFGPRLESKRIQVGKISGGPNNGCYNYTLTKLTMYLPDRGEVEFRDDLTNGAPLPSICTNPTSRGTRWHATDGSGAIFINSVDNGVALWPGPNLGGVVVLADGTRIDFSSNGVITDRNGNKTVGLTDQLGRTYMVAENVPDPQNPSVTLRFLVTIPGYSGNRYVKIKAGIMNQHYRSDINPALPVITGDWDPEGWGYNWPGSPTRLILKSYGMYAQRIDDKEVLTEVVLPDGRSLKFRYNQFGEVAEAELPTGGKIQYDHGFVNTFPTGNSPVWETTTGGIVGGITTDVKFVDRGVKARRTYPDGVNLEGKWAYGYANSTSTISARTAADALLLSEMHYFLSGTRYTESPNSPGQHDGTHYSVWSTGIEWRKEIRNASGVVIAATEQDWSQRTPVSWVGYPTEQPAQDNRVNQSRKYLDNGMMAKVEIFYDQYNNPTEVKEYDFDQTLKRRTITTYLTANNGYNYATDDSIHMLGLPLQQSVYNGGGVEQARTTYEYDNHTNDGLHAPLVDYGSVTQHDPTYNSAKTTRGNATGVGRWLNTTGSTIWTYQRYDKLGNIISVTDARGNVSFISFADDFGDGSNPGAGGQGPYGPTYALPTLITSPPPQPGAPVHTARCQYDFSTGLMTGFRDRNNVVTQTIYNDPFNRPTLTKAALGVAGVESHSANYYAPATVFGIHLTKNDVLVASDKDALDDGVLRSWTVTDGFGRTKESWKRDPQGDVKTVANYDGLGRTVQTSNPFRPSLGENAIYTTTTYDLAARVLTVRTPDSAVVTTTYSGNTITVSDQTSRQRKSVTDALGRLKEIYEDPAGLNYLTSYSYDALNNLVTVTQGTQTRTFNYDSLKRLTSATNPESGTITYTYDNSGNLLTKGDLRPIITTYVYDALNRNTTVDYSDTVGINPDITRVYDGATNGKGRLHYSHAGGDYTNGANVEHVTTDSYDALGRPLSKRQLFKANSSWGPTYQTAQTYNRAGGISTQTYPSGHTTTYTYDTAAQTIGFSGNLGGAQRTYSTGMIYSALGGMTKEQFGTDTPVYNKSFYNSRGQLSEIRVSTSYGGPWDTSWNRGSIINHYSNQCWGMCGGPNSSQAMTDNNGNLKKQHVDVPDNEQNTSYVAYTSWFEYDSLNRLKWANGERWASGPNVVNHQWKQTFDYDRYGNRLIDTSASQTYGGGINNKLFTRDSSKNRLGVPSGQAGVMQYDAAGNLTTDTYTGAGGRVYDAENRLTQAWGGNKQWQYYTYNADGQRTRRKLDGVETWQVYGFGGELLADYPVNAAPTAPTKEYGYRNGQLLVTASDAKLQPVATLASNSYDAGSGPGRAIDGMANTMWNAGNVAQQWIQLDLGQPTNLSKVRLQVAQSPSGNTTHQIYGGATVGNLSLLGTLTGNTTNAQWLELLSVASGIRYVRVVTTSSPSWVAWFEIEVYGPQVHWLVADQLGTPRMIFDQTGSLANVKRHDYLPFGEEISAYGGRTLQQGYSGDMVRQKFTSKERDIETGLDYFGARYYGSTLGRFTSCDPMIMSARHIADPQRWNMFAYVENNPLSLTDPDGRDGQGNDGKRTITVFLNFAAEQLQSGTYDSSGQFRKEANLVSPSWSDLSATATAKGFNLVIYDQNSLPVVAGNFVSAAARSELIVVAGHTGRDSETGIEGTIPLGENALIQPDGTNYAGSKNSGQVPFNGQTLAVFGCNSNALPIDGMIAPTNANAQFIGVQDVDGARGSSVPGNNLAAHTFVSAYIASGGDTEIATEAAQRVYSNSENGHRDRATGRFIYDDRKDKVTTRPIQ